jgi:hypothetical protein
MVALVIIGISIVIVLATQSRSTKIYADSKIMTVSSMLAQKKISELQTGEFPEPGEQSGVFEENERYGWHLLVNETDVEDLREIILEVSRAAENEFEEGEEPGFPTVTIVTYIAYPGEPEEAEDEEETDAEEEETG